MREKKLRLGWLAIFLAVLPIASCDDSSEDVPTSIEAPKIIQYEEIIDNPITLAFSWEAVEHAVKYTYQLEETNEEGDKVVASGSTEDLSVEIASTEDKELFYSREYVFTLKAVSADEEIVSEPTKVNVITSGGAIVLSIDNLTYRSALLKGVPADKNMLYQFAQIPVEKYTAYDSDMAFIEGYDYGYYKKLGSIYGIPWYAYMKESSKKGKYEYETRMLKPNKDYILYAYGVEFDMENPSDPVKVVTPMVKHFFTTPEWKATSTTTFELDIESQELIGSGADAIVNVNLKVTPSNEQERYYIAFAEKNMFNNKYNMYDFAFDIIYSEEIYGGVKDWSTAEILFAGEKVLASKDNEWGIYPGTEYKAMVFGVDENGLVTTAIASKDFTSIGATATKAGVRSAASMKGFSAGKVTVSVEDRN